jgi:hypothetical protein
MLNYRRKKVGVRIVCIYPRMFDWRRMNLDRKLTTDDLIKTPDLLYVCGAKLRLVAPWRVPAGSLALPEIRLKAV